jgi:DNA-binding IclR family transcriptional regulator
MAHDGTEATAPQGATGKRRRGRPPKDGAAPRDGATTEESGELVGAAGNDRVRAAPDYSIAVLDRALDVLEALAEGSGPLGVTEVARQVTTTKSAAFRILTNLERRGYVIKDTATTKYSLGARLKYLGERSLGTLELRQVARAAMEALHDRFQETVNLGVLDGEEVVYIDMLESQHGLRMAARLGARDSAHATALGKAILAFLPEAQRERLLHRRLTRQTERTITDPVVLRRELERVRDQGVAEDLGENEDGARCLGAPIFDHTGAVIAAISVSAPESRLDDRRAADVAVALREAASDATARVGGRAPAAVAAGA